MATSTRSTTPVTTRPWYYSALTQAISELPEIADKNGMVRPTQAKAWLLARQKDGKFKQAELHWSGLTDWLDMQRDKLHTNDIIEFAQHNSVRIEEKILGNEQIQELSLDQDEESGNWYILKNEGEILDGFDTEDKAQAELDRMRNANAENTKFSSYVLPGAENYKELLITLPAAQGNPTRWQVADQSGKLLNVFDSYKLAEDFVTRNDAFFSGLNINPVGNDTKTFRSSHFDQPNILAHIRMNERTDADGKLVLFIEEIQSDWSANNRKVISQITKPKAIGELVSNFINPRISSVMSLDASYGGVLSGLQNNQIREAVISRIPVDVVNLLRSFEASPQDIFSNDPVLFKPVPIEVRRRIGLSLIDSMRQIGAELRAKLGLSYKAGLDEPLLPAVRASDLDTSVVVGLLAPSKLYHVSLPSSAGKLDVASSGAKMLGRSGDVAWRGSEFNPATGAGVENGRSSTIPRAEPSPGTARSEAELYTTPLANFVNWHQQIIGQRGSSLQGKYISGPFVGDTTAYTNLALKRAIAYAVDNGFDRIAWTTGEQQAARYSLSKVVDQIGWTERGGGRFIAMTLNGTTPVQLLVSSEGNIVSAKGGLTEAEGKGLDALVGKEVAARIMAEPSGDLAGEGLNIGVAGMKGFYDGILPQVAKKLGMMNKVVHVGMGDKGRYNVYDDANDLVSSHSARWKAEKFAEEQGGRVEFQRDTQPQPGFVITDAIREQVRNSGLPLFQDTRGAFDTTTRTLTLLDNADHSTFIHESGHFFLEVMSELASQPNAPAQITNDLSVALDWLNVPGGLQAWQQMSLEQKRPYHEQFARGLEAYFMTGRAPLPELQGFFERAARWLSDIYDDLINLGVDLTPRMNEVFDRLVMPPAPTHAADVAMIRDGLHAHLNALQRFPDETNQSYATLVAHFYASQAAAAGMSAIDLAKQFPLTIRSDIHGLAPAGSLRNPAESPAFHEWFNKQGVFDQRGAPQVFYHGTPTPDGLTHFAPGGRDGSRLSGDAYGIASYFTSSPHEAGIFAREEGAIFPVYVRGHLLDVDSTLSPVDVQRLSRFANSIMLPSDKARFEQGRTTREFDNEANAEAFFREQLANWKHFGDGMERAKPTVDFAVDKVTVTYTDFDAQICITTGQEAFTLFKAIGFDNLQAAGFDGLRMNRESGASWVVLHNPDGNVKSALGNNGRFDAYDPHILHQPAYHGSPRLFDRFSLDYINSGEGSQAFGWGLYFTATKDVAEHYRQSLSNRDNAGYLSAHLNAQELVKRFNNDADWAAEIVREQLANTESSDPKYSRLEKTLQSIASGEYSQSIPDRGCVYTVDIPDDEHYLFWERPLNEQSRYALDALAPVLDEWRQDHRDILQHFDNATFAKELSLAESELTGELLYNWLADHPTTTRPPGDRSASRYLHSLGIAGIRYRDGLSRKAIDGHHNYVIFDDSAVQILHVRTPQSENTPTVKNAPLVNQGTHYGTITAITPDRVLQHVGKGQTVAHLRNQFSDTPSVGQLMRITYRDGRPHAIGAAPPQTALQR